MKQSMISGVIGILLAAQAGCGGGVDAQELQTAMVMATSMGNVAAGEAVSTLPRGSGTGEVDTAHNCLDGGNLDVTGMIYGYGQMTDLNINLNACKEGSITMGGMLHIVSSSDASGLTKTVTGEVTYSGDVLAIDRCVLDFTEELRVSDESIIYKGTACGSTVDLEIR